MRMKWLSVMVLVAVTGTNCATYAQQGQVSPAPPPVPAKPQALPGFEQLRAYMFPQLFGKVTDEKGAKAYYKRFLLIFADRDIVFMDEKGSLDHTRRTAWLDKWEKRVTEIDDGDYKLADRLGVEAMEDLGERFNYFLDPEDVASEDKQMDPTSLGIGVKVTLENAHELTAKLTRESTEEQYDKCLVLDSKHRFLISPFKDSPAEKSGVKDGDAIYKVDGEDVMDGKHVQKDVQALIKGKKNSKVSLEVERIEDGKPVRKKIVIQRGDFTVPVVHVTPADKDGIVVIKLDDFMAENAAAEMLTALLDAAKLRSEKSVPVKVIWDLRGNRGGRVDHAINIISYMLPEGTMVTSVKREGTSLRTERWTATRDAVIYSYPSPSSPANRVAFKTEKRTLALPEDVPLVILVDRNSASASELTSRAIQAHGRALICGENTVGKGVINTIVEFKPDEKGEGPRRVHVSIGNFLPADQKLDWEGLQPDKLSVRVKPSKPGEDKQLDDAKELVLQEFQRIEKKKAQQKELREATVKSKKDAWQQKLKERQEERRKEQAKPAAPATPTLVPDTTPAPVNPGGTPNQPMKVTGSKPGEEQQKQQKQPTPGTIPLPTED